MSEPSVTITPVDGNYMLVMTNIPTGMAEAIHSALYKQFFDARSEGFVSTGDENAKAMADLIYEEWEKIR